MAIKKALVLFSLLFLVVFFSGCAQQNNSSGNGTGNSGGNSNGNASGASVNMQNFAFSPSSVTVSAGTKVTWANEDSSPHTIVSDNGTFASQPISKGESYSFTFPEKGTFAYYCSIHPSMKAVVIVE